MFALDAVRHAAALRPAGLMAHTSAEYLLGDGRVDVDAARRADPTCAVHVGTVHVAGVRRHVLLDGYETVQRCVWLKRPVRVRLLSEEETRSCVTGGTYADAWGK